MNIRLIRWILRQGHMLQTSCLRLSPKFQQSQGLPHLHTDTPELFTLKDILSAENHILRYGQCRSPFQRKSFSSLARHLGVKSVKEARFGGLIIRQMAAEPEWANRNKTALVYITAIGIFMIGATYAGVPLYRIFCQATGLGGQATAGHDTSKVATMQPVRERAIVVRFNADVASSMRWNFRPQQSQVKVLPGETALAFYTARNPTDKPIIGISTYNVVPFEAGAYFNKIQCFCFEEQRLNPHEEVDMPVFFYIDPEYVEDPKLQDTDQITLSYTFFEAKEGLQLPLPGYVTPQPQPQT